MAAPGTKVASYPWCDGSGRRWSILLLRWQLIAISAASVYIFVRKPVDPSVVMYEKQLDSGNLSRQTYTHHVYTERQWSEFSNQRYLACIPHHGLGNNFFSIAGCIHVANKLKVPLIVSYWLGPRNYLQLPPFQPWGGHQPPLGPGIEPWHVFPGLAWKHTRSALPEQHDYFDVRGPNPREVHALEAGLYNLTIKRATFIEGWFFTTQNYNASLLRDKFALNPALKAVFETAYQDLFRPGIATVSVHLRLGYAGEQAPDALKTRPAPPEVYFRYALTTAFRDLQSPVRFIVLSDNEPAAVAMLTHQIRYSPVKMAVGFKIVVVNTNALAALHIMTKCDHHVLAASTFSFWGAYLAPKPGRVLYHTSMVQDLTRRIIPNNKDNKHWIEITDNYLSQWHSSMTDMLLQVVDPA
eukprot:TRINITY_DN8691_c0_g3_i1.p1 TRINITY_DN8691_c0_g3~~TRINITY_DN8691_c0_g3_i1.p1  ORF type:complete len:418 (+),score=16.29 TRINITY_DN8691_c0_g3_i1:24-1256(+)